MTAPTLPAMSAQVMPADASVEGIVWHILGQTYVPKHHSDSSMSWHATFPAGTFVPPHVHPLQDEFVYMLSGELTVELDGVTGTAGPGALVRMPKGIPHGLFNRSQADVTCLFWVSPSERLWELFAAIDGVPDPAEVVRLAGLYDVNFLPPPGSA